MITQKELNKLLHPPTYDLYILQGLNIKSLGELVEDVLDVISITKLKESLRFTIIIGGICYGVKAVETQDSINGVGRGPLFYYCEAMYWADYNGDKWPCMVSWGTIEKTSITRKDFINQVIPPISKLYKDYLLLTPQNT